MYKYTTAFPERMYVFVAHRKGMDVIFLQDVVAAIVHF